MHELMHDAGIGSSRDPINMIEKGLKKINEDILRLMFILLQIDEIKAKVDVLVKRSHTLQVSCEILNNNIYSFSNLQFIIIYDDELIKYALYLQYFQPLIL